MSDYVSQLQAANAVLPVGSRYRIPDDPPLELLAEIINYDRRLKFVDLCGSGCGNEDGDVPAVYMYDGPNKGLYSTSETEVHRYIRSFIWR